MTTPGAPGEPGEVVDVVLSQERADVGVRRVPRERVRVRREVVTEEVTVVVAVRREVLRVEREPLDGSGGPPDEPAAGSAPPLEVVLSRERPVVHLEVVPYERVRVGVRSVSTTAAVSTEQGREVLDLTPPPPTSPR